MKILVFLHGTIIMHPTALGQSRQERVRQVVTGEVSVRDFAHYVPVGDAVRKLQRWYAQGAEIAYLSSHRNASDVQKDSSVLREYGFPDGPIYCRQNGEGYADVAARLLPDVPIEDDCESIGGELQMAYPHLQPELQPKIRSVVVKEFGGLDHLPDNASDLLNEPRSDWD